MCFFDFSYYCIIFFFLGLIYSIIIINTCNRLVGRNLYNVHSVYFPEFLFLCKCCTCHTCFLGIFVKEVLECNCCKSSALSLNFNMFLGFNSLMETVRISSSRHYTSCKFIYNQYLVIFYNIVLIPEHKVMCPEGKYYIMLYVKIICICKIIYVEELLHLGNTFFSQINCLFLFINNKIT